MFLQEMEKKIILIEKNQLSHNCTVKKHCRVPVCTGTT